MQEFNENNERELQTPESLPQAEAPASEPEVAAVTPQPEEPELPYEAVEPTADIEQTVEPAAETEVEYEAVPQEETPTPAITVDLQPKKPKYKNDGLKVFFIILAAVLALSILVSGGYFLSQLGGKGNPNTHSTALADRPDGAQVSPAQEVYSNASPSVVGILVYGTSGKSTTAQASGIVYSDDGYIVTNDHVYSDIVAPKFKIRTSDGKIYDAKYVAGDARSDLAVLKTDAPNLKKATFVKSDDLRVGEEVIAIGYPAGVYEESIMTAGTISSVGRRVTSSTTSYSIRLIQTDTAINPGNSGGALLNMYGQVVGVTSSKLVGSSYDRIGFAIPSNTVVKIADSLINHGHVEGRARLGITYTAVDLIAAELNGYPVGLAVVSVSEESDLYGKDIDEGDIITHINDVEIQSSIVALDIIDSSAPGDVLRLTVYKPKSKTTVTLNATMLNDAGSSSYSAIENNNNSSTSSGTFDFPFGE